jgi:hypothetical protein
VITSAAGAIAASARDMGRYAQMLARRGMGRGGRLVSASAFERFVTPHIAADDFGADAHYGYGMVVDRLDGRQRLRHTGGMVSFASALEIDLDEGLGVFASVNAMQGVRPRPVAEYALRLLRACKSGAPLPPPPPAVDARRVARAADYAGRFVGEAGRALEFEAVGERLALVHRGERVALEPAVAVPDAFHVHHPDFAHYLLLFTRADAGNPASAVLEAGYGADGYARPEVPGPRTFAAPSEWSAFVGHYRSEDPWIGSTRIALRRGRLWVGGVVPLEPAPGGLFYLADEPRSPEWVRFHDLAGGRAMRMVFSGASLARVEAP